MDQIFWRRLHPVSTLDSFEPGKRDPDSPTKLMFEWLKRCSPDMSMDDLIKGLKTIDRYDVVDLLTKDERDEGKGNWKGQY